MQAIKHPFIVNLHYAFQRLTSCFVTDFLNGGDLFSTCVRRSGLLKTEPGSTPLKYCLHLKSCTARASFIETLSRKMYY